MTTKYSLCQAVPGILFFLILFVSCSSINHLKNLDTQILPLQQTRERNISKQICHALLRIQPENGILVMLDIICNSNCVIALPTFKTIYCK